ncbi:MAG: class I SAM-dependent methyltransferase [Nanoarchaeota archaeon]|nr:class I SAM-dependent methyltransferase [Nanoarchaeota archaeon]
MGKGEYKGRSSVDGWEYDAIMQKVSPYMADFQDLLGTVIKEHFGERKIDIVEIGFGTGSTTKAILDNNPQAYIRAIDIDLGNREVAEEKLGNLANRVVFTESDACKYLGYLPDSSCDAVATALFLHNLNNFDRLLLIKEIYRAIKPGGLFVNADKYALPDPGFRKAQAWLMDSYKKHLSDRPDVLESWIKHELEDAMPDVLMRASDALRQMKMAGFYNPRFVYRNGIVGLLVAEKQ